MTNGRNQTSPVPRSKLFDFHGVQMVNAFTNNWENIQNFKARPDDILIATYPKAGTTWVAYILDLLYFGQTEQERQSTIPIYRRVPFIDKAVTSLNEELNYNGVDLANNLPTSPRLIKTHYPVQFVPKSFFEQNCKIVYVARNVKDTMVSYYHFERMTQVQPEPGDWKDYFQRFLDGKVTWGSWYDHVNGWWQRKKTYSNIHYMFFEDLSENTDREITKLCKFLGLSVTPELKRQVTGQVQFDTMKNNKMANYSTLNSKEMMDFTVSTFMRKGKVGDWKNHFTVAQNEKFDEDYKQKMKDPTLQFRTLI
uniref:Sulfotransferase n=1 Tax=Neogobius melanostomus TaxID=47308 RepID=A0A8C6U221_9GOBI